MIAASTRARLDTAGALATFGAQPAALSASAMAAAISAVDS
jgi:hypothetical protein